MVAWGNCWCRNSRSFHIARQTGRLDHLINPWVTECAPFWMMWRCMMLSGTLLRTASDGGTPVTEWRALTEFSIATHERLDGWMRKPGAQADKLLIQPEPEHDKAQRIEMTASDCFAMPRKTEYIAGSWHRPYHSPRTIAQSVVNQLEASCVAWLGCESANYGFWW